MIQYTLFQKRKGFSITAAYIYFPRNNTNFLKPDLNACEKFSCLSLFLKLGGTDKKTIWVSKKWLNDCFWKRGVQF